MASSRFGNSNIHQRDPRSALFEGYTGPGADANRRNQNASPGGRYGTPGASSSGGGYGYGYPGSNGNGLAPQNGGYRSATPNRKGQYSDAVLNELESQNDQQIEGILGKVRVLKDMTVAIGDEIRDSSALAEKMNDTFDATRVRLRGTMNRMLLMAERTGVGWRVWLGFFAAVAILFTYVWLF
ncbi:protein transport protein bet1 [Sporothrix eucalyptigena]|uniref:Protein transport protein bet1 n=1 Tax=Sporothrix eucalyptigena TaxID=1812306 RepID=A0ABP0AW80_9PEZI